MTIQPSFEQVYRDLAIDEFGWEVKIGLNLAFYRSFAIPSIGSRLAGTGEITGRPQRRADDTGLLMYEVIYHGFGHERGRLALRQLNRIHRRYPIPVDEYRYVLACLAVVPTRWIDRYGHRPLTPDERAATHAFYRELGRRMRITGIPDSYTGFEEYLDAYERAHLAWHPDGAVLMTATRRLLADRFPAWARPLVLAAGDALLDEPLRQALGVRQPGRFTLRAVDGALRLRSRFARRRGARRSPAFRPGQSTRSHPDGYAIAELGPD